MQMALYSRVGTICLNATIIISVTFTHLHISSGYHPSFYTMVPLIAWGAILAAVVLAFLLIIHSQYIGLYAMSALAIIFLIFPTIVTGEPYGTDTFVKAASVRGLLSGVNPLNPFAPGMVAHAAVIVKVTSIEPLTLGPQFAVSLLAPFAMVVYARQFDLNFLASRIVESTSFLLPMGFGVYISTVSTFHNYYLSIPIGVLFVATITQISYDIVSVRKLVVAFLLGFILILYHPLSFLTATLLSMILYISFSVETDNLSKLMKSTMNKAAIFLIMFSPFAVYFFWFSLGYSPSWFFASVLDMLGISQQLGSVWAGTGGSVSQPAVVCPHSSYVNPCGPELVGRFAIPILLFGIALSFMGTLGIERIGSHGLSGFLNRNVIVLGAVAMYTFGILALFSTGIVGRNILIRLLPYGALGAISIIAYSVSHFRIQSFSILTYGVFSAGVLVLVGLTVTMFSTDVQKGIISVMLLSTTMMTGIAILLKPDKKIQIAGTLFLVLLISVVPILYPSPKTNAKVNPALGSGGGNQMKWITNFVPTNKQYAAGKDEWRQLRYVEPGMNQGPLRGSSWIFLQAGLTSNQSLIWAGRTFATVQTSSDPDHIFYRPYYKYYPIAIYKEGNKRYKSTVPVTFSDIKKEYPLSHKVYDNAAGYVWSTSNDR